MHINLGNISLEIGGVIWDWTFDLNCLLLRCCFIVSKAKSVEMCDMITYLKECYGYKPVICRAASIIVGASVRKLSHYFLKQRQKSSCFVLFLFFVFFLASVIKVWPCLFLAFQSLATVMNCCKKSLNLCKYGKKKFHRTLLFILLTLV